MSQVIEPLPGITRVEMSVLLEMFSSIHGHIVRYIRLHLKPSVGPACIPHDTKVNDNHNNDCDWLVDEELGDGNDNDGDGRIDEDVAANNKFPVVVEPVRTTAETTSTTPGALPLIQVNWRN